MDKPLYNTDGIKFIYSTERNKLQYGYSQQFDLYCFFMPGNIIVSYGEKAQDKIQALKDIITVSDSVENLKSMLLKIYGIAPAHTVKFVFRALPAKTGNARSLTANDYSAYIEFFKKINPGCKNTDWVREYFDEMVTAQICVGVFEGDILASCSDAPGMPYMQDEVQEIGINTLTEYRGKGYATFACVESAKNIIKIGKCPQWSALIENAASQKLAYKTGFERFADILTIML